jgi:hypothetical protein
VVLAQQDKALLVELEKALVILLVAVVEVQAK